MNGEVVKQCNGAYSPDTLATIARKHAANSETILREVCEKCGQTVLAKNYAGEWRPDTHYAPTHGRRKGKELKP